MGLLGGGIGGGYAAPYKICRLISCFALSSDSRHWDTKLPTRTRFTGVQTKNYNEALLVTPGGCRAGAPVVSTTRMVQYIW